MAVVSCRDVLSCFARYVADKRHGVGGLRGEGVGVSTSIRRIRIQSLSQNDSTRTIPMIPVQAYSYPFALPSSMPSADHPPSGYSSANVSTPFCETTGFAHESSTVLYVEASTAGGIPAQPREVPRTIELSGRVALCGVSRRRTAGGDQWGAASGVHWTVRVEARAQPVR